MPDRIPILLDTDPGSDIDDAVALAYLLRQPRCELLGVTTVSGDVSKRAAIVEIVCAAAGRTDIPIHAGRTLPLAHGQGQPFVPHYEAVADLPHRSYQPNQAVDFLRNTIRSRPGEIVLLSIGPYTNIATLFALDPEIPSLLKGIVSMGGRFFSEDHLEWNAICDPTATAITYQTPGRQHLSVGLDVTLQVTLDADAVQAKFTGPLLDTVLKMATKWFEHSGRITFHDPLAAALIFEPWLCETAEGTISVDIITGRTTFQPNENSGTPLPSEGEGAGGEGKKSIQTKKGADRVAKTVQAKAFFDHYFEIVQPETHP
jgi:purine nucleosidase